MTRFPRWKRATAAPQSAIKDEKGVGISRGQRKVQSPSMPTCLFEREDARLVCGFAQFLCDGDAFSISESEKESGGEGEKSLPLFAVLRAQGENE